MTENLKNVKKKEKTTAPATFPCMSRRRLLVTCFVGPTSQNLKILYENLCWTKLILLKIIS